MINSVNSHNLHALNGHVFMHEIVRQILDRTLRHDLPLLHGNEGVGGPTSEFDVLLHQNDGDAVDLVECDDRLLDNFRLVSRTRPIISNCCPPHGLQSRRSAGTARGRLGQEFSSINSH